MSEKQSKIYHINIPSWEKHNSGKKKNHRYFLIENRFFNDEKIAQLTASETRLYLYLLTVASDLNQSSYTLHTHLIPSYFRLRTQLIHTSIKRLESFQLLSLAKSAPNTIENKTKQDNTKEKKLKDPEKKQKALDQLENRKIKEAYFNAYRLRYGIDPVSNQTFNSQVSNLRKKLGTEDAVKVVEFYLLHNDGWYLKNTHAFGLCLSNADTLRTQMLRGQPITSLHVKQLEKSLDQKNVADDNSRRIQELYNEKQKQLTGGKNEP